MSSSLDDRIVGCSAHRCEKRARPALARAPLKKTKFEVCASKVAKLHTTRSQFVCT